MENQKITPKNRHHYVPKFYLRNFGNSKQSISTFACSPERYIERASIRNMCQQEKLYGKTDEIEDMLMECEGAMAAIIKKTIDNKKIPTDSIGDLLFFILLSQARTLKLAKVVNFKLTVSAQISLEMNPKFREQFPKYDFKSNPLTANHEVPNIYALRNIESLQEITKDLDYCLLINSSNAREFITSDEPVALDNYLAKKLKYPGETGYGNVGLLLYFPISPECCILFFDSDVYDIKYDENHCLKINKAKDIDKINRYLYLNSFSNIFFSNFVKENYIVNTIQKSPKMKKISETQILNKSVSQVQTPV